MGKLKKHLKEVILPTWNFSGRLDTLEKTEMNALVGLASEAGESLDIGKKLWFHSAKPFEFFREKLVSELGDVLYYFLITLHVFHISLDEVLADNRKKLASRHPELGQVKERYDVNHIRG